MPGFVIGGLVVLGGSSGRSARVSRAGTRGTPPGDARRAVCTRCRGERSPEAPRSRRGALWQTARVAGQSLLGAGLPPNSKPTR